MIPFEARFDRGEKLENGKLERRRDQSGGELNSTDLGSKAD
jgi:hypothetical protein